jgi:hypothetical protein
MYQFVMASVAILLGCVIAMSGWLAYASKLDTIAADTDALPLGDEACLSLLPVCWRSAQRA